MYIVLVIVKKAYNIVAYITVKAAYNKIKNRIVNKNCAIYI